ncbi:MAG: beta/gamma crystallin domain-containing protein, partial [Gammaproteobacteria bacterium]
ITVGVPVTVMVPLEFKVEPQAKGCWVELYTKESFRGDRLTLVGPLDMAKMRGPFGANWENEVESIRAGPKATVTIFENERFAKRSVIVLPDEEIGDLDNRMEVSDSFRSMRVACLPMR